MVAEPLRGSWKIPRQWIQGPMTMFLHGRVRPRSLRHMPLRANGFRRPRRSQNVNWLWRGFGEDSLESQNRWYATLIQIPLKVKMVLANFWMFCVDPHYNNCQSATVFHDWRSGTVWDDKNGKQLQSLSFEKRSFSQICNKHWLVPDLTELARRSYQQGVDQHRLFLRQLQMPLHHNPQLLEHAGTPMVTMAQAKGIPRVMLPQVFPQISFLTKWEGIGCWRQVGWRQTNVRTYWFRQGIARSSMLSDGHWGHFLLRMANVNLCVKVLESGGLNNSGMEKKRIGHPLRMSCGKIGHQLLGTVGLAARMFTGMTGHRKVGQTTPGKNRLGGMTRRLARNWSPMKLLKIQKSQDFEKHQLWQLRPIVLWLKLEKLWGRPVRQEDITLLNLCLARVWHRTVRRTKASRKEKAVDRPVRGRVVLDHVLFAAYELMVISIAPTDFRLGSQRVRWKALLEKGRKENLRARTCIQISIWWIFGPYNGMM